MLVWRDRLVCSAMAVGDVFGRRERGLERRLALGRVTAVTTGQAFDMPHVDHRDRGSRRSHAESAVRHLLRHPSGMS